MDVDVEKTIMPFEESFPQRRQQHRTSCQEHERHLRSSVEWIVSHFRNHGCSPNQLLVSHLVHDFRWVYEILQPHVLCRRRWQGGGVGGGVEREFVEQEIEGDIF